MVAGGEARPCEREPPDSYRKNTGAPEVREKGSVAGCDTISRLMLRRFSRPFRADLF